MTQRFLVCGFLVCGDIADFLFNVEVSRLRACKGVFLFKLQRWNTSPQ